MSMKQSASLELGQSLTMTPALQQAIRMLQLSTQDLHTEIQSALESNVMLEADEPSETDDEHNKDQADAAEQQRDGADIPENLPVDADWDDFYGNNAAPTAPDQAANSIPENQEPNVHAPPELSEHLTWQAELNGLTGLNAAIAAQIIDAVDADGYILDWDELSARLCQEYDIADQVPETVLGLIQCFDPPGVCARSLAECLHIQLQQQAATASRDSALQLATDAGLSALATDNREQLSHLTGGVDADTLDAAIALIRTLQPCPGEHFGTEQTEYIVPEVFVSRSNGQWHVRINSDIVPRLRINPEYLALVKRADNSADQSTLKTHLQEARFFLNSLRSRNETLLQVAQRIVAAQRAFLEYGPEAMKPLVLKDVAEALEMHESTISRATANKYIQTPRGLFSLKYFFSSHVATTNGGTCSATAIQAMIQRLVSEEPAIKPFSDSHIAERLQEDQGIRVARRTIAKYREALSIPSSSQRRRAHA